MWLPLVGRLAGWLERDGEGEGAGLWVVTRSAAAESGEGEVDGLDAGRGSCSLDCSWKKEGKGGGR